MSAISSTFEIYFVSTRSAEDIQYEELGCAIRDIYNPARMIKGLPLIQLKHVPTEQDIVISSNFRAVIFGQDSITTSKVVAVRSQWSPAFIVCWDPLLSDQPFTRLELFDAGSNMVGYCVESVVETIDQILDTTGSITCPICGLQGLSPREFHRHLPIFHINVPNERLSELKCPICLRYPDGEPLQVHVHERHGPERIKQQLSTRLYIFSLVVCRHPTSGKFLLCQEFANQGFWLPGGAVDNGENLTVAAKREAMEEAGIGIDLKGVLAVEYFPCGRNRDQSSFSVKMRVVFYAEPNESEMSKMPKCRPDFESAGACWCSEEDIAAGLRLRSSEPRHWIKWRSNLPSFDNPGAAVLMFEQRL